MYIPLESGYIPEMDHACIPSLPNFTNVHEFSQINFPQVSQDFMNISINVCEIVIKIGAKIDDFHRKRFFC